MRPEYLYIMSNDLMPNVFKIGNSYFAEAPNEEAGRISNWSAVAGEFRVEKSYKVHSGKAWLARHLTHEKLQKAGKHLDKQFYKATLEECIKAVEDALGESGECWSMEK